MHSDTWDGLCRLSFCFCPFNCSSITHFLPYLLAWVLSYVLFLTVSCPPPHILPFCRWCGYAKTPNWLWRTALPTSWTCCQTPTSTCAPFCLVTRAKWRLWVTMSISGSSWRTWQRRPSRPLACSRRARNACMRRIHNQGEKTGWNRWNRCPS